VQTTQLRNPGCAAIGGQGPICALARKYRDVSTKRQLCHCFRPCRGSRREGGNTVLEKTRLAHPGGEPQVVAHFIFHVSFSPLSASRFRARPLAGCLMAQSAGCLSSCEINCTFPAHLHCSIYISAPRCPLVKLRPALPRGS
jgi:hypothetical protein